MQEQQTRRGGYKTRTGTTVLGHAAAALALVTEIYHPEAAEYVVYKRVLVGDPEAPRFAAEEGDTLLAHTCEDERLADQAHVLNLVTGAKALVPWNALGHAVKPKVEAV